MRCLLTLLATLLVTPANLSAQSASDLFQQAVVMERTQGDLLSAIALYERVVDASTDRPLTAEALVRIGQNYERLGRDGALDAYRRIVSDYSDLSEPASIARQRLVALEVQSQPAAPVPFSEIPVPMAPTHDTWGIDLSPDGQRIAIADRSGSVVVMERESSSWRTVLSARGWPDGYAQYLRFSPDGRRIAHGWWDADGGAIQITNPESGDTRTVLRFKEAFEGVTGVDPYVLDWSRDGTKLLAFANIGFEDRPDAHYLMAVALDGTGPSVISTVDLPSFAYGRACFTGNDKFAIVEMEPTVRPHLARVDLTTGQWEAWRGTATEGSFQLAGCPESGGKILYVAQHLGGRYLFTADPTSPPSLHPDQQIIPFSGGERPLAVSESGDLLVDAYLANPSVMTLHLEPGSEPRTGEVLANGQWAELGPWDPVGRRIAWFTSAPASIHVWDSEQSLLKRFPVLAGGWSEPHWLPSGEGIGLHLRGPNGDSLSIVDPTTGAQSETAALGSRFHAFAAQGHAALVADPDNPKCIVRLSLEDGGTQPFFCLEDEEVEWVGVRENPDYSGYVFFAPRGGGRGVLLGVVDADGRNPRILDRPNPEAPDNGWFRYESPQSVTFAERSPRNQISALVRINLETMERERFWESVLEYLRLSRYQVRPDGKLAVIVAGAKRDQASVKVLQRVLKN